MYSIQASEMTSATTAMLMSLVLLSVISEESIEKYKGCKFAPNANFTPILYFSVKIWGCGFQLRGGGLNPF